MPKLNHPTVIIANQSAATKPSANAKARLRSRPSHIAADHWVKLLGSGLSDDTIAAAGVYTETDAVRLAAMLRRSTRRVPALIFPFFDREGRRINYAVARPSNPRVKGNGEPVKYETPFGLGNRAYFPPAALEAINTHGELLLITEGILKALAATQAGVPCIGLMGV